MAEISVIVPVYNVEKYLCRCIDSILAQTFSDFELILIDDGSTDASGVICDAYQKKDERVFAIHQEYKGVAAARNTGLDRAFLNKDTGWIAFIDSDDWVHEEYLEKLYFSAVNNECSIAVCDFVRTENEIFNKRITDICDFSSPEDFWLTSQVSATVVWCKIIKKQLFEFLRFPDGKIHEDEYTMYKAIFACERIVHVQSEMYYYYKNPKSIMQKQWNLQRTVAVGAFQEQCDFFHKHGFDKAELISANLLFAAAALAVRNISTFYPKEKRLIRKYRTILRRTKRQYRLDPKQIGGEKYYEQLAHPVWVRIRKKIKNARIFVRSVFHA